MDESSGPAQAQSRHEDAKRSLVSWSWKLPIAGFVFAMVFTFTVRSLSAVWAIVFLLTFIVGTCLTLLAIAYLFKYKRILRHALGGLAVNSLCWFLAVSAFYAVAKVREAAGKTAIEREMDQRFGDAGFTLPEDFKPEDG